MTSAPDESTSPQQARPPQDSLIGRVVGWLRAGYPQGVPEQDYVALLGILQRLLTPTELDRVVHEISTEAGTDESVITRALVQSRIEDVVKGPAMPEDVSRVSARLAAAGWPLWSHDELSSGDTPEVRANVVSRVVEWLRKGYPAGLPVHDFVPLIALLRRRLTDAEVGRVARELVEQGTLPADRIDVGAAITSVTAELPSEDDIERVRSYLTDHGWPTDFKV